MSRDQQPGERDDEPEADEYFDGRPRSIFSALWFRVLLAVLVLGVLAAVAVPYMLDLATHSASDSTAAKRPVAATSPVVTPPTAQPAATATPAPAPASPAGDASTTASSPPGASTTATPSTPPPAATSTPAEPAKTSESTRTSAPPARKTTAAVKTATEQPRVAATKTPVAATAERTSADGPYWVQVGAFRDAEAAARVVTRLRGQGFRAEQSTTGKPAAVAAAPPDAPGDRYAVVVSGGAPGDLDAKLAAKGMTSEATSGGAIVKPSLPLREAVALSRELADAGLSVQVRRQGPPAPSAPARATAETWHRVRVGGFPDRAAAVASLKKLEDKGYKPFIATGNN